MTRRSSFHAFRSVVFFSLIVLIAPLALAQQTGALSGKVTATDGSALPGVTIEARSIGLPQPRVTTTGDNGDYQLPALQPGPYTLTFSLSGMQTATRNAEVLLGQDRTVDVSLGVEAMSETITVMAEATLVDKESTAIQSGLSNDQIQALPVGQEYRDLQKLIPGVQLTQDITRGPSAGGSGQDNVYQFDGVNVTMPLFGVLVAEPATHDIAQVNVLKGGAKAVDFERSGGFSIDSVSKSGTNKLSGQVSYQILNNGFIADQEGTVSSRFQQDREWSTVNLGGPVWSDRLFFYGSYYRPVFTKENQSNFYGDLPSFESTRNEYFGKLTFTPTSAWLINGSYRDSHRVDTGDQYSSNQAGTTGFGYETRLKIGSLEASWVINPRSFATFKFSDFQNPGFGRPDQFLNITPDLAVGSQLDINSLDLLGRLRVPTVISTNPAQAAFVQPFIDKYGYLNNGVRTGGGLVGSSNLAADDDSFYRKNGQIGFNYTLGTNIRHDLHVGYQRHTDEEDRFQRSNGYGSLSIPAGTTNCPATTVRNGVTVPVCGTAKPAFFLAILSQQTTGVVPTIHSEIHYQNIELNDTIHMNNWVFNVGVLASNDVLYGQGLAKADNLAGFVTSPGTKYKMYEKPFDKMIQPRLGATWAYNGTDTVFTSYARYNPGANSDARAASWDRNLISDINVYFDATGKVLGIDPVQSSSGKLFVEDLDPPEVNEYMIGTAQQLTNNWSARMYARHRKGENYWEDTNNNARVAFNPPEGIPRELYIPDLTARLAAIGSGSTYVIAALDGAFTKYYEATLESDWHGGNTFIRGSYTWSHYYGNFDQDNTTGVENDMSTFIGSSNIADGAGRQLWDLKYGDLRGDRRNVLKVYGTHLLPWKASAGAFALYQSGQPYELESVLPYRPLTTSTSDSNRFAEAAGSRRTPAHHQVDLNYTQNIPFFRDLNLQLLVDLFNVYDKQTGYNYQTQVGTLGACNTNNCIDTGIAAQPSVNAPFPRTFFNPRRFQIAARLQF